MGGPMNFLGRLWQFYKDLDELERARRRTERLLAFLRDHYATEVTTLEAPEDVAIRVMQKLSAVNVPPVPVSPAKVSGPSAANGGKIALKSNRLNRPDRPDRVRITSVDDRWLFDNTQWWGTSPVGLEGLLLCLPRHVDFPGERDLHHIVLDSGECLPTEGLKWQTVR